MPSGHAPRDGQSNTYRRRKLLDAVLDQTRTCWLCGQPVDPGLRGLRVRGPRGTRPMHPESPVLDEEVPRCMGGPALDPSNVRLAHFFCNSYRGARLDLDAVRDELAAIGGARAATASLAAKLRSAERNAQSASERRESASANISACRASIGW